MQTDSAKYEFVLDNLYFAHIDGPEVQKGKVNVTLNVKRTSRAFELSFQTDGMVCVIVVWMIWNYRSVLLIN